MRIGIEDTDEQEFKRVVGEVVGNCINGSSYEWHNVRAITAMACLELRKHKVWGDFQTVTEVKLEHEPGYEKHKVMCRETDCCSPVVANMTFERDEDGFWWLVWVGVADVYPGDEDSNVLHFGKGLYRKSIVLSHNREAERKRHENRY